eukprot:59183-Chlamydomonas_euryale.AAC.1
MSFPDAHINTGAFLAGGTAALGSALIPYYMGLIVDHASIDPDRDAFVHTIWTLVWVSAATGVFTVRGRARLGGRGCVAGWAAAGQRRDGRPRCVAGWAAAGELRDGRTRMCAWVSGRG